MQIIMGPCHRQTHKHVKNASPMWGSLMLFTESSFPLPQESSRGIHTGVNEIVLPIHKAIPPFLWGKKMSRTKSGYFIPTKKRWELHLPTYKLRKNRMGSLTTTCSAQVCVGSPATRSQCRSEHLPVETQLPSVMCALLSLILSPRAEPRVYFCTEWTLSSGRATCLAVNKACWQPSSCRTAPPLHVCWPHMHPHTGTTCLGTWKDVGCQQSQAGAPVRNQDMRRTEKPRHSCEHAAQFSRNFTWRYLKPLQTSLLVFLLMYFPLLALTPQPQVSCDKMQNYEHNAKCWKIVFISTQFT